MEGTAQPLATATARAEPTDSAESWSNKDDPLATRQKEYERASEQIRAIDSTKPFIARLDGHRFSKFTAGFKKPYDPRIFEAMLATTADLYREFLPVTAYTQSDEITLVFPAIPSLVEEEASGVVESGVESGSEAAGEKKKAVNAKRLQTLMFNGKVQKMVSLLAGFCSVRFAYHMSTKTFDSTAEKRLLEKIHRAYFDARVFNLPNDTEVLWNVIWRIKDVKRNSKNNLGHCHFPQRQLDGLTPSQVLAKLEAEKQILWSDMPGPFKYGAFIKKGEHTKECVDRATGKPVVAVRKRFMTASVNVFEYSAEAEALVVGKYLSSDAGAFADMFVPMDSNDN